VIVPLHNHSEYSAIDGVSKPLEIVMRAKEIGAPAVGLTDHGVVSGHLEFDKVCRKNDINPILGCELYHGLTFGAAKMPKRDQAHLIVFAMTDDGLQNLWKMVDAAAQEPKFHHVGRNSWEDFETFNEGTIATSACVGGLVPQGVLRGDLEPLNRYLKVWGDRFYIELPTYPGDVLMDDYDFDEPVLMRDVVTQLAEIAWERGIPMVPGDDGHYAYEHQFDVHDAYIAKKTKQDIYTPLDERKMYHPPGALCIKDEATVREALAYLPDEYVDQAIANSIEIGKKADAHLPAVRRHLPVFIPDDCPWVEKGKYDDADVLFLDLVEKGVIWRYGEDAAAKVWEQAAYESEVFIEAGLTHYFLLAWDVFQFCDTRNIERGPGRGSSAGCLVAYALGITDVDPLPYDLYFERFWNPGRAKGFPDIDSDFEKSRRKEVKGYLTERWGHDRVRSIGNTVRLKPKATVENFGIACGLTWAELDALKKLIEDTPDLEILGPDQIGWHERSDPGKTHYVMHGTPMTPHDNGEKIQEWVDNLPRNRVEIVQRAMDLFEVLCNRVSNYGVHASGIVISDEDLPGIAPCRFAGSADQRIPVTQFPMEDIDALLLIKLDALGLRTLDVLGDWRRTVKAKYGVDINWSGLEWRENDPEMWGLLADGFAAGIFQIEDNYPKQLCQDFKPQSVADLSIINALNRPGPIRSGAPASLIKRRAGEEPVEYLDPFLEDLLDETYGWFIYQEEVIAYFKKLGYDLGDADAVRKILGKKQPEKWAALYNGDDEWEGKAYVTIAEQAGVTAYDPIWEVLKDFGKYSFNKSHTVAYATVGFRTLFAKYLLPDEFYAACIRNVAKDKRDDAFPRYVNEARRWGIEVLPPSVLFSSAKCDVVDGAIHFGLSDVKGVGLESAEYFVYLRDEVGAPVETPDALFAFMEELTKERERENRRRTKAGEPKLDGKSPKQLLRANQIEALVTVGAWDELGYRDDVSLQVKQAGEKELINVILTDNTKEAFANNENELAKCDSYEEAFAPWTEDRHHKLLGVVVKVKETKTKAKGEKMGVVTIAYEGDTITFAVFPNKWSSSKFMWKERTPVVVNLTFRNHPEYGPGYSYESGKKLS
jgi:DNA polymerase-3 subunit alpha